MKKIYTLSFILLASTMFSQTPVITALVDGPCSGGTPKVLEIYANGTVDFTLFTLENQTNANTTWTAPQSLSALGTRTNEFVYVIMTNVSLALATKEFPGIVAGNSIESSTMNLNGDDKVRIINTSTSAVIDQFGTGGDGTGLTWEWLDSYAKRKNGTVPTGSFVETDWTFAPINTLDTAGLCLTPAGAQLQTIVALGNFTLSNSEFQINGLKVYPNPVKNGNLYITSDSSNAKTVAVYDILGKQVINTKTSNNAVNVANLKSGAYIVKVTEDGKTDTRKLIIQ
jgi:hypothetical protein